MPRDLLFGLMGGLGLFLFGMRLMSEGLRKVAGTRLRHILQLLTKTPLMGVLLGAAVTGVIQSSSATTVMVVGIVNAGLIPLKQAISIVMGANIGTTVTAWWVAGFLSAFKISYYALPAIGLGFALNVLGKTRKTKFGGQVLLGLGMLLLGLSIMKDPFSSLKGSEAVKDFIGRFSKDPLLGVLAGSLVTIMLQSSSATIAIVQVMMLNGLIGFEAAIPLILGDNIGTTITAQLAAIGAGIPARRTAMSHTMFNVIGVAYLLPLVWLGWYARAIRFIVPMDNPLFLIAGAHTVFNVFNTLIFLPLTGLLARISVKLVPGKPGEVEVTPRYLEKHLLDTPPLALDQARKEIIRMTELAREAVNDAMKGFLSGDLKSLNRVAPKEEAIDNLQSEITQYLVELSQKNLSREESQELPVLLHSVNDIERVGDHAENLMELAQRKLEGKLPFSEQALGEIKAMFREIDNMMGEVMEAFEKGDAQLAKRALKREDRLNQLQIEFRQHHIQRLNEGSCKVLSGIVFLDFVNNLEKIGDHLTNVAQAVMGSLRWERVSV